MKTTFVLAASAVFLHYLGVNALPAATTPAYPICTSTAAFASVDDVHRRLFNYNGTGASFFAGTNIWWASHILSDADLQQTFEQVKDTQLQVARVWGFGSVNSDPGSGTVWFQMLNSTGSYINYAANGMPRLDAVVSYAEEIGIKLVLPFVNNWLVPDHTSTTAPLTFTHQVRPGRHSKLYHRLRWQQHILVH
jgi:mannan endo-1,4-beta-mannosidase